jgi:hypothetical protein
VELNNYNNMNNIFEVEEIIPEQVVVKVYDFDELLKKRQAIVEIYEKELAEVDALIAKGEEQGKTPSPEVVEPEPVQVETVDPLLSPME